MCKMPKNRKCKQVTNANVSASSKLIEHWWLLLKWPRSVAYGHAPSFIAFLLPLLVIKCYCLQHNGYHERRHSHVWLSCFHVFFPPLRPTWMKFQSLSVTLHANMCTISWMLICFSSFSFMKVPHYILGILFTSICTVWLKPLSPKVGFYDGINWNCSWFCYAF